MSKKQFIKRHMLVINKLRKHPSSFEEIEAYLQRESVLDEENYEVSVRTFQRDIKEIASLYNIEIEYNRSRNVYEIANDANDERNERIMESYEIFNALNLTTNYAHHLVPEKRKPLGTENMYQLLNAIRTGVEVQFLHEKFWEEDSGKTIRRVSPIALKEARHRWYLVAQDSGDGNIKSFGLERMSDLEVLKTKADYPADFNIEEHFRHCFGIICEDGLEAETVILAFSHSAAKYIKSLPLHPSQKIISESEQQITFELFLYPTYDFVMELMSYGSEVTIIKPKKLRTEVKNKLQDALAKYQ